MHVHRHTDASDRVKVGQTVLLEDKRRCPSWITSFQRSRPAGGPSACQLPGLEAELSDMKRSLAGGSWPHWLAPESRSRDQRKRDGHRRKDTRQPGLLLHQILGFEIKELEIYRHSKKP